MTEAAVTRDTLLGGRVALCQPKHGYRVAIDPVLLAAGVPAKPGQSVLDVGCGTGAVFLCLAARVPELAIIGVDASADVLDLARRNAEANGVAAELIESDIHGPSAELVGRHFHHVVTNPPFWPAGSTRPSTNQGRNEAYFHKPGGLEAWIAACAKLVRSRGMLSAILPSDHLVAALGALNEQLGSIALTPLWPKPDRPARRVIVQGIKDGRGPTVLRPGLVLHDPDGRYSGEAKRILNEGEAIPPC